MEYPLKLVQTINASGEYPELVGEDNLFLETTSGFELYSHKTGELSLKKEIEFDYLYISPNGVP